MIGGCYSFFAPQIRSLGYNKLSGKRLYSLLRPLEPNGNYGPAEKTAYRQ